MHDPTTFEARLAAALQRRADQAPTEVDASALAHSVASVHGRPTTGSMFVPRGGGVARLLVLGALLALGLAAALALGSQTQQPAEPRLGRLLETGPMTTQRDGHTATLLSDGRVLLVGGDEPPSADLYDPVMGTFTRTGGLTTSQRFGMAATLLHDGRVLVVGGMSMTDSDDLNEWALRFGELYDPTTGAFRRTGEMAEGRGYLGAAVTLPDGRVLVAGGDAPDVPAGATEGRNRTLATVELYDPATEMFLPGGTLLVPRTAHTLSLLPDGRVLVAGGWGPDGPIASAEIYDPATGTSAATSDMTSARAYHAAVSLADGRVLVVAGTGPGAENPPLDSVELFDPAKGTFQAAGWLITERSGATAARMRDGRVLVAGGNNRDGDPRTLEAFDPTTGTSEVVGRITPGQDMGNSFATSTTLLADGTVLIAGGNGVEAVRFDPVPRAAPAQSDRPVEPAGPVAVDFLAVEGPGALRTGHTATRLADGRVLIAGGTDGGTAPVLATAEIFDPATGGTTPTGSMVTARSAHAATLLADGRVLLAGGLEEADPTMSWPSAELYDPVSGTFAAIGTMTDARTGTRVSGPQAVPDSGHPAAVTLHDGRALIVDWDPASSDRGAGSVQLFDPASGAFSPSAILPGPSGDEHVGGAVLLPDGRVLALVGAHFEPTVHAYVYDRVTETWAPAGEITVGEAFSTTGLPDGRVLVAGGVSYHAADGTNAGARIWDPAIGSFSATGDMAGARAGHVGTLLPDGRVLITGGMVYPSEGGQAQDGPLTPEKWDPGSGTFSPAGMMVAERSGHTATLLPDGRVLIVGGVKRSPDRSDPTPAFAELYVGP